jgi:hypothetical protein
VLLRREKFEYDSDEKNNWTKRVTWQFVNLPNEKDDGKDEKENFEPLEITYRTLTYY